VRSGVVAGTASPAGASAANPTHAKVAKVAAKRTNFISANL